LNVAESLNATAAGTAASQEPTVLALDFDGVLCNGMKEYFQTAWRAYCVLWSAESTPPTGLAEQFYRVRPLIATGWEMPILLHALLSGYSPEQMAQNWEGLAQTLIAEAGLTAAELAAQVDGIRDRWIATDPESWLAEQGLYPGIAERLPVWLTLTKVVIISTKEKRFIQQILAQSGLNLPELTIFGKEVKRPKHQILRELKAEAPTARFWFVEDRLKTLEEVHEQPDLKDVVLFLADWGYNTAAERATVVDAPAIHLISLEQFCRDFATWK
jgi:phosphoglycolate phosphatase-like HAD superfamily hydrolase